MPFKSNAQRKFMFAKHPKMAEEFAAATPKNADLPEHVQKYAEGGEVENPMVTKLREMLLGKSSPLTRDVEEASKANSVDTSSDTAHGYADGGEVTQDDPSAISAALQSLMAPFRAVGNATQAITNSPIALDTMSALGNAVPNPMAPGLQQAAAANVQPDMPDQGEGMSVSGAPAPRGQMMVKRPPVAPPLSQTMKTLQQTPPTNPSIYQGITAADRAKLMQQLIAQKSSPGNLVAQGAAGLGDAIANSFGKGGANAAGDVKQMQQENMEQRLGAVDTERAQRMQDLQASIAQQEADPRSPYSSGMRDFLSQLTGKPMPSGMSAAMLKTIFPDYVKIFDAKLQATTASGEQKIQAAKELSGEGLWHTLVNAIKSKTGTENEGEEYLASRLKGPGTNSGPASTGGWSVKR